MDGSGGPGGPDTEAGARAPGAAAAGGSGSAAAAAEPVRRVDLSPRRASWWTGWPRGTAR
ncbi:hypothetical protein VSR01_35995 [Actinacidiphila sp. DG2A-62]|uniref:hypothetical protein n=1 Tax=Actinacidiphila sp. DG2A-62 TaxID=3108821 RepID=UPI002DBBD28F|nr:hypothetical protein [Actinacidiphila sp. DG2A-62]MEC3998600.1 hypothetical protein [Actinacidiphila sp. DG2A-62]